MKTIIFVGMFLLCGTLAEAATFAKSWGNFFCKITMNGPITLGDDYRFKEVLSKVPTSWEDPVTVCLNSPGGNWEVGLELARLFLEGGVGTVVLTGSQCYSTCAILFMFGSRLNVDSGRSVSRRLAVGGALGFHAPFITESNDQRQKEEVFKEGVAAIRKFMEVLYVRSRDVYIAREDLEKFFPPELVIKMLLMEPNQLLTLKTINDVGRWDIQLLAGPYPAVKGDEETRRLAFLQGCLNASNWWISKRDSTALKDDINYEWQKTRKPNKTKSFTNGFRAAFDENSEPPRYCIVTEYYRTNGNSLFLFQSDDRYEEANWFSKDELFDNPRTANEDWVAADPATVICDEECQTVRPFRKVR